jgi:hypothetical protein
MVVLCGTNKTNSSTFMSSAYKSKNELIDLCKARNISCNIFMNKAEKKHDTKESTPLNSNPNRSATTTRVIRHPEEMEKEPVANGIQLLHKLTLDRDFDNNRMFETPLTQTSESGIEQTQDMDNHFKFHQRVKIIFSILGQVAPLFCFDERLVLK